MLKKIILIFALLFITGCSSMNIKNLTINEALNVALNQDNNLYSDYEIGYRYYSPRCFSLLESKDNNFVFINKKNKYYMYVDVFAYYNNVKTTHNKGENSYYFESFNFNSKDGYIDIVKKDSYFYLKMMYNYAIIEVKVKEEDITEAVINSGILLSSIDYNYAVIDNLIGEGLLNNSSKLFELQGPVEKNDETYLDYVEKYDSYEKEQDVIKDPDVIS